MRLKKASVLLLTLLLPACAGNGTPLPGTTKLIDELPRVQNSTKSPCWQQEQIAAQNSYVDTIKGKKDVAYKAPCKVDKQQKTAS
jgi:hypothetical protein